MKSITQVTQELLLIREKTFGGKAKGRYKMSLSNFRVLCERKRLDPKFLDDIISYAIEEGLVITVITNYICVVEIDSPLSYRPVPKSVLAEFLTGSEHLPKESEEDE